MTTQQLFDDAVSARGPEYVRARERLLAAADVKSFLEMKSSGDSGDDAGWLAGILSKRLADPEEFARLEKEFNEKVRLVKLGFPNRTPAAYSPIRADISFGLRLPDEAVPTTANAGRDLAPDVKEFHQLTRLPPSDCWPPFLAEVLLKGWSPTVVPGAADPKPLAEQKLDRDGIPQDRRPRLAADDYLRQAILLLGKFGEVRAVPRIADLLMDKSQDGRTRLLSARALGFLKSDLSVETLLHVVEDDQTAPAVRVETFAALGRLKDARAVPVLERIAANPDDTRLPGGLGPHRWKGEARYVLKKIRGQ